MTANRLPQWLLTSAVMLLALQRLAFAQIVPQGLGTSDDAPIIQAAINSAPAGSYIQLPGSHTFNIKEGLTFNTAVIGFDGNGSCLNYENSSGAAITASNSSQGGAPYTANIEPFRNVCLTGPGGGTSGAGPIGILVETSNWSVHGLNLQGFTNALQWGNYGYTDWFYDATLMNNYDNVYCPAGIADAGENISFIGGTISNSSYGIYNQGCEFNFDGISFDAVSHTPIMNNYGVVRLAHDHIERFSVAPILTGGSNAYSHTTITDTDFLTDGTYNLPLVQNNGGYTQLEHIFLSGFSNFSGFVTGSAPSSVQCQDITSGSGGGSLDNVLKGEGACP